MTAAIKTTALGKRYFLNHSQQPDSIKSYLRDLLSRKANIPAEEFWPLQNINIDVYPGECLALTGENGSGKSTLLKILSRVIPPTTGHAEINGRLASLLEIGTGFHPELTGRENIFLNGAILGCPEATIKKRLDEIIYFSEVEKFIDIPVKHYSSGMYVRLAYSVAAHIDANIILIDEVLAVGDSAFQTKCLQHIKKAHKNGVAVVFVSHDEDIIKSLATRTIKLSHGTIIDS